MYRDTVTLFNRHKGASGDVWYPTILYNVNLNLDKAAIVAKYGAESKDNAVLNVRYEKSGKDIYVSNKIWLPPKEWGRQTNDILPGSLTFTGGQKFDFFWLGEWNGGSPINDDAYGVDGFYNYMNTKYDYVFAVNSAAAFSVIPHFEITGK